MSSLTLEAFDRCYPLRVAAGSFARGARAPLYRFTDSADCLAPGTNVSFWQTQPNTSYANVYLFVSTLERLGRMGEVRLDPLELNQGGGKGISIVVWHRDGIQRQWVRLVRPLRGWGKRMGEPVFNRASVKNHIDCMNPSVWSDLEGVLHFED